MRRELQTLPCHATPFWYINRCTPRTPTPKRRPSAQGAPATTPSLAHRTWPPSYHTLLSKLCGACTTCTAGNFSFRRCGGPSAPPRSHSPAPPVRDKRSDPTAHNGLLRRHSHPCPTAWPTCPREAAGARTPVRSMSRCHLQSPDCQQYYALYCSSWHVRNHPAWRSSHCSLRSRCPL